MRRVRLDVGHSSESASKRAKLEPGSHEGCSLGLDYASDEEPEEKAVAEVEEKQPCDDNKEADALLDSFMTSLETSGLLADEDTSIPHDSRSSPPPLPPTIPVQVPVSTPSAAVADMIRTLMRESSEAAVVLTSSQIPLAIKIAVEAEIRMRDWQDLVRLHKLDSSKGLDWALYSDYISQRVMDLLSDLPKAKKEASKILREQRSMASASMAGPSLDYSQLYSSLHMASYSYPFAGVGLAPQQPNEDLPPLPPDDPSPPPPPPPPPPPADSAQESERAVGEASKKSAPGNASKRGGGLGKKNAAMINQWASARSEMEADEMKREEQLNPEKKRQREVARWKEDQERQEDNENPNFQPIRGGTGDWRSRFAEKQQKQ